MAEPSLAVVSPAAAWEENWREAIEEVAEEAEREAREAREIEREMGRKDTILAVVFFLVSKEKQRRCYWNARKKCINFVLDRLLYRRASWVAKMVGGEAGSKGGERWADPVVSRAAELRLVRLFCLQAWSGAKAVGGDESGRAE